MKLLIVDDHPVMRDGLAAALAPLDAALQVLEAGDGAAAMQAAEDHADLDAVLLDLRLASGGLMILADLRARRPALPVVIVSSSEDAADVRRTLAAGARGYIPKSAGRRTMLAAMRLVLAGETYVPPLVLQDLPGSAAPVDIALTPRQMEVLRRVSEGLPNREIGLQLDMHEKTVKAHVTAIFRALGVVNREQAVEAARAAGLVG